MGLGGVKDMNEADYILVTYKNFGSIKATKIECGVSEHRIRKVLTARGVVLNDTHQTILDLYEQGKTSEQIAAQLRLSKSVVQSYLPPKRPLYRVNQSVNALRIAAWRKNKKNNGE